MEHVYSTSQRFPSVTFCPVVSGDGLALEGTSLLEDLHHADALARTVVPAAFQHVNKT